MGRDLHRQFLRRISRTSGGGEVKTERGITDKELEALKRDIKNQSNPDPTLWEPLIRRLEAAEKVCRCLAETGFPKSLRHSAYDHMNEWRRAKGE